MTSPTKTAVILAAGLGSRLKEKARTQPKAFIKIDNQTLIERSIDNLVSRGITNIIIGTGYLNHFFDELKTKYPQITTCKNENFATTGSMYTLYVVRDLIRESFLLLEGDLLYEPAALDYLLNDEEKDVILASDATNSGDEVYIQSSMQGHLRNMNKNKDLLEQVDGEFVGITKLSFETFQKIVDYAHVMYSEGKKEIHYEDALVGISDSTNVKVKVVKDMAWCEIDDESHLHRALQLVYPKILNRTVGK